MGLHLSERERRASEAERELIEWKKVRFMAGKLGEVFSGYVTGVQAFGLFVELEEVYVQGLVHVSSMTDDYYRFDERAHLLKGENTAEGLPAGRPRRGAGRRGSTSSGGRSTSRSSTCSSGRRRGRAGRGAPPRGRGTSRRAAPPRRRPSQGARRGARKGATRSPGAGGIDSWHGDAAACLE